MNGSYSFEEPTMNRRQLLAGAAAAAVAPALRAAIAPALPTIGLFEYTVVDNLAPFEVNDTCMAMFLLKQIEMIPRRALFF